MLLLACLIGIVHGAVLHPRKTNSSATPYGTVDGYLISGFTATTTAPQAPATRLSLWYISTPNTTTVITTSTSSSPFITPLVTVEFDTYHLSTNPNAPTQWVLYPTSLAIPCYLEDPGACHFVNGVDWYDYYSNDFKDPYYDVSGGAGTDTLTMSCESIWSSSLVTWIKTAPTTYLPAATTPAYKTVLPTTVTVSSTIYWMGTSTETVVETDYLGGRYWYESYQITVKSVTSASVADYTSTIVETTVLIPTQTADTRAYFLSAFPFTAVAPCCSTCSLFGKNVQVFQWPTPAPSPPISTLIDPRNNFTFVSPQVYVAFESVFATDLCGTLGSVLYTTVGFSSKELSTSQVYAYDTSFPPYDNPFPPTGFTEGIWGQFSTCTNVTSTFWQALGRREILTDAAAVSNFSQTADLAYLRACSIYSVGDNPGSCVKQYSVTYNPCSPVLSVPTKVFALNPLWTGCIQGISAFFDPPYTLTPGGPLSLTTADPATYHADPQPITSSNPAIAGPTLAPVTPARTSVFIPKTTAYDDPNPVGSPVDFPAPTASGYLIGSQTLAAGGIAVMISNTEFSLLPDGSSIAIGGSTTMAMGAFLASKSEKVEYLFGTQTLSAGGSAITVDGTAMSLMIGGSSLVVGSRTEGASVLVGGTPSRHETEIGGALQQTGTQPPASGTSTSTGGTSRQRGDRWTWILGALIGGWIIAVGFL
ncbi:hypothetical protein N431DRAFT_536653 [Stipitochalara longipes BDJ]|nr:hypothetical protein N431DRAFT_536653 [Stipitochalara longipes BDJ]